MGRLLLALSIGVVGALIVHIGVIFAMPLVAEDNAWARLTQIMPAFRPSILSAGNVSGLRTPAEASGAAAGAERFGFLDPAFMTAACRVSTADGPVRLRADEAGGFWSASIIARSGDNLYSINARLAPRSQLDLTVGTQSQLDAARIAGLLADEDSIPVVATAGDFYLTLRALVEGASERPFVDRFMRSLSCEEIDIPDVADILEPTPG